VTTEAELEHVEVAETPYVDKGNRFDGDSLAAEIRHLLPGDHPDSIARRLKYKKLDYLIRNLERNGYNQLASELLTRASFVRLGHDPRDGEKRW
jgi:hypothetical protein